MDKEKIILAVIYKKGQHVNIERGEDCSNYELYGILSTFTKNLGINIAKGYKNGGENEVL